MKTRRKFIKNAGCAAMGSLTLMNSILNLKTMHAAAASNSTVNNSSTNNYKAIVCILLAGGNDSYNMLIPNETTIYNGYSNLRQNLTIPIADVLPINDVNGTQLNYGLHPSMSAIQNLFNQQKASFVSNVGTLIEPLMTYNDLTQANTPFGLFSHSDQIMQWQTANYTEREFVGWGGKMVDLLNDTFNAGDLAMNISLTGTNLFQSGNSFSEYAINPFTGSIGINGHTNSINPSNIIETIRTQAVDSLIEHHYTDIFKNTFVKTIKNSNDTNYYLSNILNTNGYNFNTPFDDESYMSNSFRRIAEIIAVQNQLNTSRNVFFINFGGWDLHDEVLVQHDELLTELSLAMKEFYETLEEIGYENDVLTFTVSDFGRTLTSNGDGSDHGWGGNAIVMGSPTTINGGQIFGNYPNLVTSDNSFLNDSRGILIPSISSDSYMAEFAKWFGVPNSDLNGGMGANLFPNLHNFWLPGQSNYPIGFIR